MLRRSRRVQIFLKKNRAGLVLFLIACCRGKVAKIHTTRAKVTTKKIDRENMEKNFKKRHIVSLCMIVY